MKQRLDAYLALRKLVPTRSQAESAIRLGDVTVNSRVVTKPGTFIGEKDVVKLNETERYVSRAGLKLASVAKLLGVDFRGRTVLDVGSSTGGFTDYALQHGATKVWAVDVGTKQLHPSLRGDKRIRLHEKTDIRDFKLHSTPDIVVMDVSFISLREILPHIAENLSNNDTQIVAMLKPQFEAGRDQVNKGVIKNDAVRRQILRDFEDWSRKFFVVQDKRDSEVAGAKGNRERFYLLKTVKSK
ncbi:TlyA family RNA methyltransferase [Candidatus Saccharibacteria bacterium]|nr:TlyA family RNA methyltransferase [Candidatus Saccharibacteria bacterium]MBH2007925.1 TlyA family RNA methyltransferase [Candidatus Saccharibacteria bacterium]